MLKKAYNRFPLVALSIKKPHKYAVFLLCGILVASNLTIFYIIPGILVHAHALLFASYADTHR